jgi:hypothetical protein
MQLNISPRYETSHVWEKPQYVGKENMKSSSLALTGPNFGHE